MDLHVLFMRVCIRIKTALIWWNCSVCCIHSSHNTVSGGTSTPYISSYSNTLDSIHQIIRRDSKMGNEMWETLKMCTVGVPAGTGLGNAHQCTWQISLFLLWMFKCFFFIKDDPVIVSYLSPKSKVFQWKRFHFALCWRTGTAVLFHRKKQQY